jgi:hypothetical protein
MRKFANDFPNKGKENDQKAAKGTPFANLRTDESVPRERGAFNDYDKFAFHQYQVLKHVDSQVDPARQPINHIHLM